MKDQSEFSKEILDRIWEKAARIKGLDDRLYRQDACGALVMRNKYGMTNPFGWVVDRIFPKESGGDERLVNLRVMHYLNSASKADDYPSYMAAVKWDGKENVPAERPVTVNGRIRKILKEIYINA